ncbi:MAG: pilus assembly protein TadG-related protein [Candidatus Wallbacteria bacterium]|nr:pilus assembly protein TadG-related protein [Candidatus Wallbacteria bacterium]
MKIIKLFFLSNRKGISTALVAICSPLLLGMLALALDVGNAYMHKSALDQAAQLAALSAAQTMKTSIDQEVIRQKVYDIFAQNGLPTNDNLTVNVTEGSETVLVEARMKAGFFATLFGFSDITINSQALAELCVDGTARLIKENTYDFMPWGIPHAKASYNAEEKKMYLDGIPADSWNENSAFAFQKGSEYLLKLGWGQPADSIGRKILIPMDSTNDCIPTDADDPICPEVGSHVQADLIKAYGLIYWCTRNNIPIDWILDYNGGSFMVDYNPAILSAVSSTGVSFSGVSKIVLTGDQAAALSNWLATHNNSEGRVYKIVRVSMYPNIAVFTANVYSPADLMPWGVQTNGINTYPFGYSLEMDFTLPYATGASNWGALELGGTGADQYRDNIMYGAGNPDGNNWYVGKSTYTKTGSMAGPTLQALQYRIDNNKLYVKLPVVSILDVNGRKSTIIKGFLNFKINATDSANGTISGRFVDKVPTDQLSYTTNEDINNTIVAKVLIQAGIPFFWIHDAGILDGDLNNFDWLYSHHEDFQNNNIPAAIARWVSRGHYFFNMCWSTDRFDNALEDYNHDTFGTDTSQYIPLMFFKSCSAKQYSVCYRCGNGKNCDACRYSGWVWEWVKHEDVNTDYNPSYTISPKDIMQTQNHVSSIPADAMIGRTHAFKLGSLIPAQNYYAKNNSAADYNRGIYGYFTYSSINYAKNMIRDYKINPDDLGGIACFMGGHDPASGSINIPAYRMILNNVVASSISPATFKTSRTNYGSLDLDSEDEGLDTDNNEYLASVKYGYKYLLTPNTLVHTLPLNLPEDTNAGVCFNVGNDANTWNNYPIDSPRVILVPIVSTRTADNMLVTTLDPANVDQQPRSIYSIYKRDLVRIKAVAKFWLLDVTRPGSYDSTLGPIENGQVRGVFLGYYIPPAD